MADLLTGFVDNRNSESLRKSIECQVAPNVLGLVKESYRSPKTLVDVIVLLTIYAS
jgi:hypothetical protein